MATIAPGAVDGIVKATGPTLAGFLCMWSAPQAAFG